MTLRLARRNRIQILLAKGDTLNWIVKYGASFAEKIAKCNTVYEVILVIEYFRHM